MDISVSLQQSDFSQFVLVNLYLSRGLIDLYLHYRVEQI